MKDSEDGPKHLALVIGIDDYPFIRANPLRGCRNDADRMAAVLAEGFGFQVVKLLDKEATRERLIRALEDLLERADTDDRVVLHFSGHGSQIKQSDGHCIETWLPQDSGRGQYPNRDIRDYELYAWLHRLSAKTPYVTLIFDSCHAGGIVRDLEATVRCVDADDRPDALSQEHVFVDDDPAASSPSRRSHDSRSSSRFPPSDRFCLLAGCRADERARELEDPSTGLHHGAFSYLLLEELTRRIPGPQREERTARDLHERVSARLGTRFREQHPHLEGARDRQIFGALHLPPMRFVPVLARRGNHQVVLDAGAVHGIVLGSRWKVYPSGTRSALAQESLGELEITRLDAVRAGATLLEEIAPGAVDANQRAVEVMRPAGVRRLTVGLWNRQDEHPDIEELARRLDASHLLDKLDDFPSSSLGPADFVVYRLPPRSRPGAEIAPLPRLGELKAPVWAVVDGSGRQVMPPKMAASKETLDALIANLETLTRSRALAEMTHPTPEQELTQTLEVVPWKCEPYGTWHRATADASNPITYRAGDTLGLHLRNHGDILLYFTILDLGLTGSIQQIYPVRGASAPLRPLTDQKIGCGENEGIELFVPDLLPFAGETFTGGWEQLVVIATTEASDLSLLAQPGVRHALFGEPLAKQGSRGEAASQLTSLLSLVAHGLPERDARYGLPERSPGRWTVQRLSFWLQR